MYMARYLDFFPVESARRHDGLGLLLQHSSVARDLLSELLRALGAEVGSLGRVERDSSRSIPRR